jgi:hypothetical protein
VLGAPPVARVSAAADGTTQMTKKTKERNGKESQRDLALMRPSPQSHRLRGEGYGVGVAEWHFQSALMVHKVRREMRGDVIEVKWRNEMPGAVCRTDSSRCRGLNLCPPAEIPQSEGAEYILSSVFPPSTEDGIQRVWRE